MRSLWRTMLVCIIFLSCSSEVSSQLQNVATNNNAMDLLFLIDGSYYVTEANFRIVLKAVVAFIETLPVGPDQVNVAAISYSVVPKRLDFTSNIEVLRSTIPTLFYDGQAALTHVGLDEALTAMTAQRSLRPDAAKVVILVAESFSLYPAESRRSADRLKNAGVQIWAVGIGPYVRQLELIDFTSNISRTFLSDRFDVLPPINLGLSSSTSVVPTEIISTSGTVTAASTVQSPVTVGFLFSGLYSAQIPAETAMSMRFQDGTITAAVKPTSTNVYISTIPTSTFYTSMNPTPTTIAFLTSSAACSDSTVLSFLPDQDPRYNTNGSSGNASSMLFISSTAVSFVATSTNAAVTTPSTVQASSAINFLFSEFSSTRIVTGASSFMEFHLVAPSIVVASTSTNMYSYISTAAAYTSTTPSVFDYTSMNPSAPFYTSMANSASVYASLTPSASVYTSLTPSASVYTSLTPSASVYTSLTPSASVYTSLTPSASVYTSLTPSATTYASMTNSAATFTSLIPTSTEWDAPTSSVVPGQDPRNITNGNNGNDGPGDGSVVFNSSADGICIQAMVEKGFGYVPHPQDCDKFIQCHRSQDGTVTASVRFCPRGLFWKQANLACVQPDQTCCSDPCTKRCEGQTYRMDGGCDLYWECIKGVSRPRRCLSYQSYIPGNGCVFMPTCVNTDTRKQNCPLSGKCEYLPVADNSGYNLQTISGSVVFNCWASTDFDLASCSCRPKKDLIKNCPLVSYFNFTSKIMTKNSVSSNNIIQIGCKTSGVSKNTEYSNNTDCSINRSGVLSASSDSSRAVTLQFQYVISTNRSAGSTPEVLVRSNACDQELEGILVVSEDATSLNVKVLSPSGYVMSTSLPLWGLNQTKWRDVYVQYFRGNLFVELSSGNLVYNTYSNGGLHIPVGACGWKVGIPDDLAYHLSVFTGDISEVLISRCNEYGF